MNLPLDLGRRLNLTLWVEGTQIRWDKDMPKPKGTPAPGDFWIEGPSLFYVDQAGTTRLLLGKVISS